MVPLDRKFNVKHPMSKLRVFIKNGQSNLSFSEQFRHILTHTHQTWAALTKLALALMI